MEEIKVAKIENPLVKQSETVVEDISTIISKVHNEYTMGESIRSTYHDKQARLYRMRYGIRKVTNIPFKNASNQSMPLIDKTIRKMKPEYVNSVWSQKPMCSMVPEEEGLYNLASQASYHLDYLTRSRMNIYPTLQRISDIMLQKGFTIGKVVYEKKYEPTTIIINKGEEKEKLRKQLIDPNFADIMDNPEKFELLVQIIAKTYGFDMENKTDAKKMDSIIKNIYESKDADNIEFTINQLVYDAPKVITLDPESVIVPADTITEFDLENARIIIHRYQITIADMLQNVADEKWDKEVVMDLIRGKGVHTQKDLQLKEIESALNKDRFKADEDNSKDLREGQGNPTTAQIFTIFEVCLWYDSDGDGVPERHVLDYCEDNMKAALRFCKYPYNMPMWPYFKTPFELTDGTHYSTRGIAEMLFPLNSSLNEQHNMKMNRQFLGNTPVAFYNVDQISKYEFQNLTLGKPVACKGDAQSAIKWMAAPSNDNTFMNEENILRNWAEEMSASTDSSANLSGTATEAKMNASYRAGVRQADIDLFNMSLREMFKRIWALWLQFGPSKLYTPISDNDAETKEYILSGFNKAFQFNVNGRIGVGDPVIESQKSLARLDRFKGDPRIRQEELYKDYLQKDDYLLSKKLLKTPEEMAKDQNDAMQQQLQMATLQQQAMSGDKQMLNQKPR